MGEKKVVLEGVAAADAVGEEEKEEAAVAEAGTPGGVEKKENEPVGCIQEQAAEILEREFPEIGIALAKKAKEGDIPALKMLLDIRSGKFNDTTVAKQQGGKSLGEMLMDELKRRQDEREAAADAAKAAEQVAKDASNSDAGNEGANSGGEAE